MAMSDEQKQFWHDVAIGSLGPIGSIISSGLNVLSTHLTNQQNETNVKNTNQANKDIADANITQQKDQLDYQKYLNTHQIQLQSADAQKAGINPLAMQGGSLSAGSYSNVDANQQAAHAEAPQVADLGPVISQSVQSYNQRKIARESNQLQIDLAEKQQNFDAQQKELDRQAELQKQKNELDFQAKQKELDRQQQLLLDKDTSSREWQRLEDERKIKAYQLEQTRKQYLKDFENDLYDWYNAYLHAYGVYGDKAQAYIGASVGGTGPLAEIASLGAKISSGLNIDQEFMPRLLRSKKMSFEEFKYLMYQAFENPKKFHLDDMDYYREYDK